ncbi:MAG: mechanosensitive ion channel family protein [Acidobacteria bacterium]|nr:MAG: mechanosensitive ion channel family protein [Acidobacteriota bacterium]
MESLQGWNVQIVETLASYGPRILGAAVILVGGYVASRGASALLRRALVRAGVEAMLVSFLANVAYVGLLAFVGVSVLSQLGIDTKSFAAMIAAAGLAIGLALQRSLGNFAAGVLIILRRPFDVGDFIEAAGIAGTVEGINVFTTELRSSDNKRIVVPNSKLLEDSIVNYNAKDTRRIDLTIGIGYDDDLKKAKDLLRAILDGDERVLRDPPPTIDVAELAESSVNLAVRSWVETSDYWRVRCDLLEAIKLSFDREGISLPYPQQDVHLYQAA